jgi:hypothetical protein
MLKKTITYKDLDGNPIVEDFYFNLSKAELAEMELSQHGGMEKWLTSIIASQDGGKIIAAFKEILRKAYGRRSNDNKSFIKTDQAWVEFESSDAYSELFMDLVTDAEAGVNFIKAVMPSDLVGKVQTVELPTEIPTPNLAAWESPKTFLNTDIDLNETKTVHTPKLSPAENYRTSEQLRNMTSEQLIEWRNNL